MRWNRRATIGVLAVMSGGIAAYAALLYLQARPIRIAPTQGIETTKVVVAARNLPAGSFLGPNDVKTVNWPSRDLPEGIADNQETLMGRGLIRPVDANEPILKSKLAEPGAGGGLAVTIPEGMRALSVSVNEVVGVAGFVLPGTRVDVILVITPPGGGAGGPISRVILQDVPTLTAGQTTTTDEQGKPLTVSVVTLLVTPGDAEKLALATTQGRIQLALRNTLDQEKVETNGVRVASLLGGPPPARTGAPRSASSPRATPTDTDANAATIEIYRAGVRTLIKY